MMKIEEILAVVTLYEKDLSKSETLLTIDKALAAECSKLDLLLYDNSATSFYDVDKIASYKHINIEYFHNPVNPGLGAAYNYGAKKAVEKNKKWILLLDQDTAFTSDLFEEYRKAMAKYPQEQLLVPALFLKNGQVFSPCKYKFKRGFWLKKPLAPGLYTLNKLSPVNSGMMIDLNAYLCVGGYNEKIKLDFSDFQFVERFRKYKNTFVLIKSTALQDFSDETKDIELLNRRFILYCESAKGCDKNTFFEKLQYGMVVFMRALSLSVKTKNRIYFRTFFRYYL